MNNIFLNEIQNDTDVHYQLTLLTRYFAKKYNVKLEDLGSGKVVEYGTRNNTEGHPFIVFKPEDRYLMCINTSWESGQNMTDLIYSVGHTDLRNFNKLRDNTKDFSLAQAINVSLYRMPGKIDQYQLPDYLTGYVIPKPEFIELTSKSLEQLCD